MLSNKKQFKVKQKSPSQIVKEILVKNKLVTYDLTKIMANRAGCKEDSIRRSMEPDRIKNVAKIYSDKGHIIAWKLITKKK